jgi:hypothetical protein
LVGISLLGPSPTEPGRSFHHNNTDLDFGIKTLFEAPEAVYSLGLSPDNGNPDAKYHRLKVKVDWVTPTCGRTLVTLFSGQRCNYTCAEEGVLEMIPLNPWFSIIAELLAAMAMGSGKISGYPSPAQTLITTEWLSGRIESALHSLLFGKPFNG